MESLDESTKNISSNMGFFKHVFNFDNATKAELLNILQYSLLGTFPIVVLNKTMQKYVPEADDKKGNIEILGEVILQIFSIFIGIYFIHRVITYFPTYSGEKYPSYSVTYIILSVLMITLSLQTKLGEKVSILSDRVVEVWEGKSEEKEKKDKKNMKVKVRQPINQGVYNPALSMEMSNSAMNQALTTNIDPGTTSIDNLPNYNGMTNQKQKNPDFDSMYNTNYTGMPGAASPVGNDPMANVPMAANEALGGSAFGSSF
jgi:hypothetical protein